MVALQGSVRFDFHRLARVKGRGMEAKGHRRTEGRMRRLLNPDDDHSLLVFDPKIRSKTDRFVYRFGKPR